MSPRQEREAAQDDLAEWGVANVSRFAPIPCPAPDERKPVRVVPAHLTTSLPNLVDTFNALPVGSLKVEANGLLARMLGATYSTRDFAIVNALINHLDAA